MVKSLDLDVVFPVPVASRPQEWSNLERLFVAGRPRHIQPGNRVWIRHGDTLVWSYEFVRFTKGDRGRSDIDGSDFGVGLSLLLKNRSGKRENIAVATIPDPSGVAIGWSRGIRYLQRNPQVFVRVGR